MDLTDSVWYLILDHRHHSGKRNFFFEDLVWNSGKRKVFFSVLQQKKIVFPVTNGNKFCNRIEVCIQFMDDGSAVFDNSKMKGTCPGLLGLFLWFLALLRFLFI